MIRQIVFAGILCATVAVPHLAHAQKLVYIVRHAERADEPAQDQEDPPISAAGEARAMKLRDMLAHSGVRAIYVTTFQRTQQTARPLATALSLTPETSPSTTDALIADLKARHGDDVVLVVAHAGTIPAIVRALTGRTVDVSGDYGSLFVIVPATQALSMLRY